MVVIFICWAEDTVPSSSLWGFFVVSEAVAKLFKPRASKDTWKKDWCVHNMLKSYIQLGDVVEALLIFLLLR